MPGGERTKGETGGRERGGGVGPFDSDCAIAVAGLAFWAVGWALTERMRDRAKCVSFLWQVLFEACGHGRTGRFRASKFAGLTGHEIGWMEGWMEWRSCHEYPSVQSGRQGVNNE